MTMNATLKAICNLLREDDPELQVAALRVLGAIHTRESGVHKALGEVAQSTNDPEVLLELLHAIEENPHEQSIKHLLLLLDRDGEVEDRALDALARIGGKFVPLMKQQFPRLSRTARHKLAYILPRIQTPQSHAFLVECFFDADHELVREAVHALRAAIDDCDAKSRTQLVHRLNGALSDTRLKKNDTALSALIIAHGILGEPRSKENLLKYVRSEYPQQIRRHALMSLGSLGLAGDKHRDVFEAVMPILGEADFEGLVKHAVTLLSQLKPRRADNNRLRALLQNRLLGVRKFALHMLGQINSITNAELILGFLHHPEHELREAAAAALRNMPAAVEVILRHIDDVTNRAEAVEMVRILESHENRIKPDRARAMIRHMLELYEAGDDHFQLYRTALCHLRPDTLREELVKQANKKQREKGDYEGVRDALKILDDTPLMTPEIRFRLAVAKLKTGRRDLSRAHRLADYALEHIATLLRENPKSFQKQLLSEKALEPADYLYVGFHFSESLHEERRFGVDLLRHVVKKSPRSKAAAKARKKLKIEAH